MNKIFNASMLVIVMGSIVIALQGMATINQTMQSIQFKQSMNNKIVFVRK